MFASDFLARCRRFVTCLPAIASLTLSGFASPASSAPNLPPLLLAVDAEFGVRAATSAQAIQYGAEIAVDEINAAGGVLGGRQLKVITRNNNSVPARAAENLKELATDPDVIAIMGGKYGPVYQQLTPLIHELGMIYLDPWSATEDITGHGRQPDYIFRLSTKDSWALAIIVKNAAAQGHKRLGIVLPNNGWGRSSLDAARKAMAATPGMRLVGEQWYNFGDPQFGVQYDELRKARATAIILVANEVEGATLVREIGRRPPLQRMPVYSHWGVTGGQFFSLAGGDLAKVDFSVVQTYSFIGAADATARRVAAAAQAKAGVSTVRAIPSPVGVAHAYDLTHILARAINRAGKAERAAVRAALEEVGEYRGLIRRYKAPFAPGRHDALDADQGFMARYAPDGAIERIR